MPVRTPPAMLAAVPQQRLRLVQLQRPLLATVTLLCVLAAAPAAGTDEDAPVRMCESLDRHSEATQSALRDCAS